MRRPKISVVVPTYSGSQTLGACLDSLSDQGLSSRDYEVIVVDDGSKEDLVPIVRGRRVRLFRQKNMGPASARNLGIQKALGRVIAFTDDDCVADKNWLRLLLKKHEGQADAVGGLVLPSSEDTLAEKFESLRKKMLYGSKSKTFSKNNLGYLPTCNLSVKRAVFDRLGLFDTTFKFPSGEDTDFCYRICKNGGVIQYFPPAVVIHRHPTSLKGVFRRQYLHSRENVLLSKKNFGTAKTLKAGVGYLPNAALMFVVLAYLVDASYLPILLLFLTIFLVFQTVRYNGHLKGVPYASRIPLLLLFYAAELVQTAGYSAGLLKYGTVPSC